MTDAIAAVKLVVDPNYTSGVAILFADVLKDAQCGSLAIEWLAERYWSHQMPAVVASLNRLYGRLRRQKSPLTFNDLDDKLWVEPDVEKKVLVHTTQSQNYLYIWPKVDVKLGPKDGHRGLRQLHVRRFWDEPREDDARDLKAKVVAGGVADSASPLIWATFSYSGGRSPDRTDPPRLLHCFVEEPNLVDCLARGDCLRRR